MYGIAAIVTVIILVTVGAWYTGSLPFGSPSKPSVKPQVTIEMSGTCPVTNTGYEAYHCDATIASVTSTEDLSNYEIAVYVNGTLKRPITNLKFANPDLVSEGLVFTYKDTPTDQKLGQGDAFSITTIPGSTYKVVIYWAQDHSEVTSITFNPSLTS